MEQLASSELKEFGEATIDYLIKYYETIRERPALPSAKPGYVRALIPSEMPDEPEKWTEVLKDIDRVIMPGMTHWNSPRFHAYYPSVTTIPSLMADLMSTGLGVVCFSWISGPACTELELVMLDWLARAMDLPEHFLNSHEGPGGGVVQGTASEATLIALVVAKEKTVQRVRGDYPDLTVEEIKAKLVCYTSDQSNSSVEKAAKLCSVPIRMLNSDRLGRLDGHTLQEAVIADKAKGLIPCYVIATFGTTGTCAFDLVEEIGPVCQQEHIWLHIDAAYAGAALLCPEFRHLMPGLHYADSLVVNAHKWMLVNFDCAAMWVKCANDVVEALNVDRIYLKDKSQGIQEDLTDLRDWQIPLGCRFRSLKLWYTMRLFGLSGLQAHIRKQVQQALDFEQYVVNDPMFEIAFPTAMGLVCFRLKGENKLTTQLMYVLNERKKVFLIPAMLNGVMFCRLAVCSPMTTTEDLYETWQEIKASAKIVLFGGEDEKCKATALFLSRRMSKQDMYIGLK